MCVGYYGVIPQIMLYADFLGRMNFIEYKRNASTDGHYMTQNDTLEILHFFLFKRTKHQPRCNLQLFSLAKTLQ